MFGSGGSCPRSGHESWNPNIDTLRRMAAQKIAQASTPARHRTLGHKGEEGHVDGDVSARMEERSSEYPVAGPHQVPQEQPEWEHDHHDEQQGKWCVTHADVRERKDNRLHHVREIGAEEGIVLLEEQSAKQQFFQEAVGEHEHQERGSEREIVTEGECAIGRKDPVRKRADQNIKEDKARHSDDARSTECAHAKVDGAQVLPGRLGQRDHHNDGDHCLKQLNDHRAADR